MNQARARQAGPRLFFVKRWNCDSMAPCFPTSPETDMHLVIRKFPRLHSVREAAQRAETGLMTMLRKEPGFLGYSIFDAGDGVGGSVTFFQTEANARAAIELARIWIRESLLDRFDGEPEIVIGEILYSGGPYAPPPSA
jgi:hypothetical protein